MHQVSQTYRECATSTGAVNWQGASFKYDQYTAEISVPGTYIGVTEICAAAESNKRDIRVYTKTSPGKCDCQLLR